MTPRASLVASSALLAFSISAAAAAGEADGVYGRLDGDVTLGAALGAEIGRDRPRASGRLAAHYFWTVGAMATYRDSLSNEDTRARIVSFAIDLRPAFLIRWPRNLEHGPPWLDLVVDAWSLDVGAYFGWPGTGASAPETGLQAGLGFALPLTGSAAGPWLGARGILGWPELTPDRSPWGSGLVTLGYDWIFDSGLLGP